MRKICIVTASRADYGLLRWLMDEVAGDDDLVLQVVVTGAHLLPSFGETWREIDADGHQVDEKVEIGPDDDTPIAAARALSRATVGLADAFGRIEPDIVVVLGDRYEILGAASAALLLNLTVAHIHGGEVTEGALDDSVRHAVTKLSHLHFVAAAPYQRRIVQMGEDPKNVFNVGALGVEAARRASKVGQDDLERDLGMPLSRPLFVVTFHPVTREPAANDAGISALLDALAEYNDARIVFTGVNADPGYSAIDDAIREFAKARTDRVGHVESLGAQRYLSLVGIADVVIGNSSSGIIEAPALGVPTVNIGDRQKGRLMAGSIVNCPENVAAIRDAIKTALAPGFMDGAGRTPFPYDGGDAAARICAELKGVDLTGIKRKPFHDVAGIAAA